MGKTSDRQEISDDTLLISFDQYQRYKIVSDIINQYRQGQEKLKILEVGASFEENIIKFLPDDEVFFLDIKYPPEYKNKKKYIVGDITQIDLQEKYDFVISIDTYEHIPPSLREEYIYKVLSLSEKATIIAAPFNTKGVAECEISLNETYKQSHENEYKWLQEHIKYGLPSLSITIEMIKESGFQYKIFPNGYLPRWFENINLYLLTEGRSEFSKILTNFWKYYNENFYEYDNKQPAYRQVILIDKSGIIPDFSNMDAENHDQKDFTYKCELMQKLISKIKGSYQLSNFKVLNETINKFRENLKNIEVNLKNTEEKLKNTEVNLKGTEEKLKNIEENLKNAKCKINSLSQQLNENNVTKMELENEISSMKYSIFYQLTSKFHNCFIERLLPEKTRRRDSYKLVLSAGRILIAEGPRDLWWHYNERKRIKKIQSEVSEETKNTPEIIPRDSLEEWNGEEIIFPELSENPEVSIVIPVYNNVKYTFNCLSSLLRNTTGSFEIIVVDDSSQDETPKLFSKIKNIIYIRNEKNSGFVESCNNGAAVSKGKYILFLNNDTIVMENWLEPLRSKISSLDVGAVGSKLIYPEGELQEAGGIIWKDASGLNYGRMDNPKKPEYNFVREVDYCSGASLIVKKELFEKLGGFDNRFKPGYYEDTDICFAIRKMGYKIIYQPKSVVVHFEGITSGTNTSSGMKKYQEVNRSKFISKWSKVLENEHYQNSSENIFLARNRAKGKNILVIDHYVPTYDRDSGSYRMYNVLRILVELGHRVTFIGDNLQHIEPYTSTLQQEKIEVIYGNFFESIQQYLSENGNLFDVVILSRSPIAVKHISNVRNFCPRAKLIFDTVDLHFLRESRRYEVEKNNSILNEVKKFKRLELQLARTSDSTWVVSPVEREFLLKEEPTLQVEIVSNIHEIHGCKKKFSERKDIMFIGGFAHSPNVDGVKWFLKNMFPLIKEKVHEIKFYIVGNEPTDEIKTLASNDIIVTGYVEDVSPYFENCRVFVSPIRYGAGVKGKINQSMSYGLPVVTTSIGAEGMSLIDGENSLVADTPEEFANKTLDLYTDENLWEKISQQSVNDTKKLFSYEVWKEKIKELI